ncbi:MAG: M13 family peptidase, partial [Candidatus Eisenbacteria bacterium]
MSARGSLARLALLIALPLVLAAAHAAAAPSKPIDPANMDTSVKPGDDFFLYANGAWLKKNPIPADQTEWGGFIQLYENNHAVLHDILESAANSRSAAAGSAEQLAGDFYASALDSARVEAAGATPIADEL